MNCALLLLQLLSLTVAVTATCSNLYLDLQIDTEFPSNCGDDERQVVGTTIDATIDVVFKRVQLEQTQLDSSDMNVCKTPVPFGRRLQDNTAADPSIERPEERDLISYNMFYFRGMCRGR